MAAAVLLGAGTMYMLTRQAAVSTLIQQTVALSEQADAPGKGELSAATVRGATKL